MGAPAAMVGGELHVIAGEDVETMGIAETAPAFAGAALSPAVMPECKANEFVMNSQFCCGEVE